MKNDELWAKWGSHYRRNGINHGICRDGIINPELFQQASRRLLFVMREANMKGKDVDTDLRKEFDERPWPDPGKWAAGILHEFPGFSEITLQLAGLSFRSIAVINLKKASGGTGTADLSVINAYAWLDRELLREQVKSINAQIVLACGTFDALTWVLELPVNPDHPARIVTLNSGMRVVPFRHPSHDPRREETYNRLKALLTPLSAAAVL